MTSCNAASDFLKPHMGLEKVYVHVLLRYVSEVEHVQI